MQEVPRTCVGRSIRCQNLNDCATQVGDFQRNILDRWPARALAMVERPIDLVAIGQTELLIGRAVGVGIEFGKPQAFSRGHALETAIPNLYVSGSAIPARNVSVGIDPECGIGAGRIICFPARVFGRAVDLCMCGSRERRKRDRQH